VEQFCAARDAAAQGPQAAREPQAMQASRAPRVQQALPEKRLQVWPEDDVDAVLPLPLHAS
jgi:hypothetical protein